MEGNLLKRLSKNLLFLIAVLALFAVSAQVYAAAPICPHVIGWNGTIGNWAQGAPWIKVMYSQDVAPAKATGAKVFYRPWDADSNNHDDANLPSGQTGTQYADLVWAKLNAMSTKPDAVSYRNEFNWDNATSSKRTCAEFVNYYNRLRADGYNGKIIFGSFGVGWVDSAIWDDPDLRAATDKADGVETHEYFDLTVDCISPYLCYRHRDLAINAHPDHLGNKQWFIGEFGSDHVCGPWPCSDPQCRGGWQDNGKLTSDQYIAQLDIYSKNCHPNVAAVFLFQQGSPSWSAFETMGTPVEAWMKTTWTANTGTLTGNVKSTGGQNLSGATVTISGGNGTTATDSNGNYTIYSVTAGSYTVTASKSGYLNSPLSASITTGQTTTKNFTLTPLAPGTLTGNVKTSGSQNLSGATVTLSSGLNANTDASGNYTIGSVPVGSYTATASKSGYMDSVSNVSIASGATTTQNFTMCTTGIELLTNGSFNSGVTGWSHSENPSSSYWGSGNKAYPGTGAGAGGYSWNAYLACGGGWCDKTFTGEQHQDNVPVQALACYSASAQVYYEPVAHPNTPSDQKSRIVLKFNDILLTTHTSTWHTQVANNGWDKITLTGNVPTGASKVSFKVELADTDGQWSGTSAIDECSFVSAPQCTAPSITSHPANATKNLGESVTFTTAASGTATLSYQWKKGASSISGATSASYTISSVTAADAGSYSCTVTNGCGTATSNAATLTVNAGSITGSVKDKTGASVSGASVATTTGGYSATSAANGSYTISSVPVGTYTVKASKSGYLSASNSSVTITAGSTATSNLTIQALTPVASIMEAKSKGDGTAVSLTDKVVTASSGSAFWIEETNRASAIKAVASNSLAAGTTVNVAGVLTTLNAEQLLDIAEYSIQGTGIVPRPLGLTQTAIGGNALYNSGGPSNIGLLVRVWGIVKKSYTDRFFIDDGTQRVDFAGQVGLKIASGTLSEPSEGGCVIITGIITVENIGGKNVPVIFPRNQQDIIPL